MLTSIIETVNTVKVLRIDATVAQRKSRRLIISWSGCRNSPVAPKLFKNIFKKVLTSRQKFAIIDTYTKQLDVNVL
jgi:hypothetical protein